MSELKIFTLYRDDDAGASTLTSSEFEKYEHIFDECGYEGGGYDWEAVAKQTIKEEISHLQDEIKFDSEGSKFCAYSNNYEALRTCNSVRERFWYRGKITGGH